MRWMEHIFLKFGYPRGKHDAGRFVASKPNPNGMKWEAAM